MYPLWSTIMDMYVIVIAITSLSQVAFIRSRLLNWRTTPQLKNKLTIIFNYITVQSTQFKLSGTYQCSDYEMF